LLFIKSVCIVPGTIAGSHKESFVLKKTQLSNLSCFWVFCLLQLENIIRQLRKRDKVLLKYLKNVKLITYKYMYLASSFFLFILKTFDNGFLTLHQA